MKECEVQIERFKVLGFQAKSGMHYKVYDSISQFGYHGNHVLYIFVVGSSQLNLPS